MNPYLSEKARGEIPRFLKWLRNAGLLFFNTKVRILAQKRLRDRLKIYLQTLTPDNKGCYHLLYSRTELADFLCVDRSALSRELCRMRDEKLLEFSGAKIKILDDNFLRH